MFDRSGVRYCLVHYSGVTDESSRKADNPIVFASDGFVSVTGYSRSEVVPRNCRFLQGNYTDRNATRRLKASIEAREETVELLLNYKKSGEPFWNLLYVGKAFSSEIPLLCKYKSLTATKLLCLTSMAV